MTAIIAGTGNLPVEACKNLIHQTKDFFVISLFPEDNLKKLQSIVSDPKKIIVQDFFKAATLLDLLKKIQPRCTVKLKKLALHVTGQEKNSL